MSTARRRHFGEKAQYDNVSSKGDHDHLICTDCGEIVEFKDSAVENLRQRVAAAHGFCLTAQIFELYGLCSRCKFPAWMSRDRGILDSPFSTGMGKRG
jgi:Fur family ferric uptake transcriptional regulator